MDAFRIVLIIQGRFECLKNTALKANLKENITFLKYSDKIRDHAGRLLAQTPEEQTQEALRVADREAMVNTDRAFRQIMQVINRKQRLNLALNVAVRIAASLFIPLLVFTVWTLNRKADDIVREYAMQEISTQPGMRSQVILPDGTRVWLNAESSLSYSIPFADDLREVSLSGEAFFEVTRDDRRPMHVDTRNATLRVLGTKFNVKAYADEPDEEFSLLDGSVSLLMAGSETQEARLLRPGDHAVIGGGQLTVVNENLDKYASWRFGSLVFDETPMPELCRKLERWFGVEVTVTDAAINSYRFTTTFSNQSLSQVLELLELSSPIAIRYEPGTIDKTTHTTGPGKVYISRKKSVP